MLFGVMCALGGGHCEGHYLVCFNGLGVILMDINRPFISEWMKFLNMMIIGFFFIQFSLQFRYVFNWSFYAVLHFKLRDNK